MVGNMEEAMEKEEKATKNKPGYDYTYGYMPVTYTDPINMKYIAKTHKDIKNGKDICLLPNAHEGIIRGSELRAWGLDPNELLIKGSTDKKLIEMIDRIL